MKLLGLFSIHFLYLMVIQGLVVAVVDNRSFRNKNNIKAAKKAKALGYTIILLSVLLFAVRAIIL